MTSASQRNSWIFGARPKAAARLRLFCFPYAGGGADDILPVGERDCTGYRGLPGATARS